MVQNRTLNQPHTPDQSNSFNLKQKAHTQCFVESAMISACSDWKLLIFRLRKIDEITRRALQDSMSVSTFLHTYIYVHITRHLNYYAIVETYKEHKHICMYYIYVGIRVIFTIGLCVCELGVFKLFVQNLHLEFW